MLPLAREHVSSRDLSCPGACRATLYQEEVSLPSIDTHVGNRIAAGRRAAGLSIEGLAARVGITPAQLRTYEAGEQRPTASELLSLNEAFGVSPSYFFEGLSSSDAPSTEQCESKRLDR